MKVPYFEFPFQYIFKAHGYCGILIFFAANKFQHVATISCV